MEGVSGLVRWVFGSSSVGSMSGGGWWWWMSTYPSSNHFKRLVTLLVVLATLVWMLRRVRRVRQRQQATLNRAPSTFTSSQHSSSSSSSSSSLSSSSSSTVSSLLSSPIRSVHVLDSRQLQQDAKLSPQLKYLAPSPLKRPAVITTSVFLNWSRNPITDSSATSPSPSPSPSSATTSSLPSPSSSSSSTSSSLWSCSVLSDDVLAVMYQLAANTTLYILHCEQRSPQQSQQDSTAPPSSVVVQTLVESGIFEAGLAKHRVLCCWNESGLSAMVRQLQPQLFVDDNVMIARSLCAYVQDCVVVERASSSSPSSSSSSSVSTVAVSAAATPSTLNNIGRHVPMFYVSCSLPHFFRYQVRTEQPLQPLR